MALACLAAPVHAQEKPGDADLCYKSVSTAEVTIPDVVAACSRVIATPGKGPGQRCDWTITGQAIVPFAPIT